MHITGRRYDTHEAVTLTFENGKISAIEPAAMQDQNDICWLAPGFVDLQINGYGGPELTNPALEISHVEEVTFAQDGCGVTAYCPTLVTQSFETLHHSLKTIAAACAENADVRRRVAGIHLEGPYLSPEDGPRGAHPLEHCRAPSIEEFKRFQEAAAGDIKILTISPEYEEAPEVIRQVADSGVLVAIGHTAATPEQIQAAADAGATMSTHLGNGAHGMIRRHPNYIWSQLADDRLTASLIADGHHLPAEVVKVMVRAKTPERIVLVSDITGLGGAAPGRYSTSLGDVEVLENGRLVVAGQRQMLAGAALPIGVGVPNMMRFADLSLAAAMDMASVRPAKLLGREHALQVGQPADLVCFRLPGADGNGDLGELSVCATVLGGKVVYRDRTCGALAGLL